MIILQSALIPISCALVGWSTPALGLRLLFRPRRPRAILGLKVQGLLPAHQGELARAIGQAVREQVDLRSEVLGMLDRPEVQSGLDGAIREKIDDFLDNKLKLLNPMMGMFLSGSLRDKLKDMLVHEVGRLIPALAGRLVGGFGAGLDLGKMVEEKIWTFDLAQLEAIAYGSQAPQRRALELLGGLYGFLVGLVIMLIGLIF